MPQGQIACLLIKNINNEPMGTISAEVLKVFLECKNKNVYFTRSYRMQVESSKRCPWVGSCTDDKCSSIKVYSRIEELSDEANRSPGFSYCVESCGCAKCGCFSCSSGCLFYRTYVKPKMMIYMKFFHVLYGSLK